MRAGKGWLIMGFSIPRGGRRLHRRVVAAVIAGGVLLAATGCGSEGDSESSPTTSSPSTPTTAASTSGSTGTTTEFCSIFQGLSERRSAQQDGFVRYPDEAAWDRGIESVEQIVASAPEEISTQAATYLQLVNERKGLAASYDYTEVPADAKLSFGRAHAAMQQQANQLIAYAKSHCSGVE